MKLWKTLLLLSFLVYVQCAPAEVEDKPAEKKVETPKEDETPQLEDAQDKTEEKEEDQEGNEDEANDDEDEESDEEGDDENDVQETEDEDENAVEESDEDARRYRKFFKKVVFKRFRKCGKRRCRRNCRRFKYGKRCYGKRRCYKWCRWCKKRCYRKCYRFRVRHGYGYKYRVKCFRTYGCRFAGCGRKFKVKVPVKY